MLPDKFYNYIATEMILGKNSPEIRNLSVYKMETIKSVHKGLCTAEESALRSDGRVDKIRKISFPDDTNLYTTHINISNDIARIVTYINIKENVNVSDVLFNEEEFKYNKYIWDKVLKTRIDRLTILIKALNETYIDDVPLILNDFPNIVAVLFIKSHILMEERR
jgi:hypothetical protein